MKPGSYGKLAPLFFPRAGMSLYAITTYFNPCGYRTRRANYDAFAQALRKQKVPLLTVEGAFGDEPFELDRAPGVIQVRAQTLLWQKERLLNLAANWLPSHCTAVAWLDCDIVFDNRSWGRDLMRVLDTEAVAQTWETCDRLDQNGRSINDCVRSFAAVMNETPETLHANRYDAHGHTGYGWAMRRSLFDEVGLYEAAVSGSADHFMAHAVYGHIGFCVENALKHDARQVAHFRAWSERFHRRVQGRLGVVPGNIRHLWHGDLKNRRYFLRMHDLTNLRFDPWRDLKIVPGQPLAWAEHVPTEKPGLVAYFDAYFRSRREDGIAA